MSAMDYHAVGGKASGHQPGNTSESPPEGATRMWGPILGSESSFRLTIP